MFNFTINITIVNKTTNIFNYIYLKIITLKNIVISINFEKFNEKNIVKKYINRNRNKLFLSTKRRFLSR